MKTKKTFGLKGKDLALKSITKELKIGFNFHHRKSFSKQGKLKRFQKYNVILVTDY